MTTAALITMLLAWTIITFFTVRFFRRVLMTPQEKE
jgi:hypothetical protein